MAFRSCNINLCVHIVHICMYKFMLCRQTKCFPSLAWKICTTIIPLDVSSIYIGISVDVLTVGVEFSIHTNWRICVTHKILDYQQQNINRFTNDCTVTRIVERYSEKKRCRLVTPKFIGLWHRYKSNFIRIFYTYGDSKLYSIHAIYFSTCYLNLCKITKLDISN